MSEAMNHLSSQRCSELAEDISIIGEKEAAAHAQDLDPPWQIDIEEKTISHTFSFKNFYQTMAFVNVIAQIAHQQDHHPDLLVGYNRCTVKYTTHSIGGLSMKDFICAAKINVAQNL
jgi:4a-hydroxytetrahydrobiopterin dehydratase